MKTVFPQDCQSVKGVRRDCQGRIEFLCSEALCAEPEDDYELFTDR